MTKPRVKYIVNLFIALIISLSLHYNSIANETDSKQSTQATQLRIGILSKRGPLIVQQRWSEMAVYLQQKIPEYQFIIVPLSFDAVRPAVQNKQIDFLLTNSGMFVDLSFSFDLFAIATLKRKIINQPYTEFGSVVFTRIERDGINQLSDLIATDIAAVNRQSLGGWIAALRELDAIGFSMDSVNSLDFLGTHDAVVYAVVNRTVDVGIIRTDTLERMAAEGKIHLSTFKALPVPTELFKLKNYNADFPLLHTTRLYPEWPIVSLAHVPETLTEKMSSALLLMPAESKAAINAQIMGWTIPKNYSDVDRAFSQLNIGFYQEISHRSILNIITHYWKNILLTILLTGLLSSVVFYVLSLSRKLKETQFKLDSFYNKDPLTGLPNRILFFELANRYLHLALSEQKQCMLLAVNLSEFEQIKNEFGYDIGEQTIKEAAIRISQALADNELLGKMDGNKFLVLLVNSESVNNVQKVVQAILNSVERPFFSESGFEVKIELRIGVSQYPQQGTVLNLLIQHADIALKQDKGFFYSG